MTDNLRCTAPHRITESLWAGKDCREHGITESQNGWKGP